jgi:hypothetical protein
MAISRNEFDQVRVGDKIFDSSGKEWIVTKVNDKANREICLFHEGDTYCFTFLNGLFLDENRTIFYSLSDKKAKFVPLKQKP